MKIWIHANTLPEIEEIFFCSKTDRGAILASISSRDITKSMVRTKSSNIWSYAINVRDTKKDIGDVYVQFKGSRGGPGDIYVLYDVPTRIYRKWMSASSKGSFYWRYLRNNYKYSKITGDKKGKLKNAVNNI